MHELDSDYDQLADVYTFLNDYPKIELERAVKTENGKAFEILIDYTIGIIPVPEADSLTMVVKYDIYWGKMYTMPLKVEIIKVRNNTFYIKSSELSKGDLIVLKPREFEQEMVRIFGVEKIRIYHGLTQRIAKKA